MSKIKKSKTPSNPIPSFENAHGKIPYGMTNDYMFRAVLQSNNIVLRGLICALFYSDKMTLSVIDLNRIDLATEEDKAWHIDEWAALFKAETWEELKAMSDKNNYFKEATETMYRMSADERIRKICRDRIEHQQDIRNYQRKNAELGKIIAEKDEALAQKDLTIQQLTAELERLKNK